MLSAIIPDSLLEGTRGHETAKVLYVIKLINDCRTVRRRRKKIEDFVKWLSRLKSSNVKCLIHQDLVVPFMGQRIKSYKFCKYAYSRFQRDCKEGES